MMYLLAPKSVIGENKLIKHYWCSAVLRHELSHLFVKLKANIEKYIFHCFFLITAGVFIHFTKFSIINFIIYLRLIANYIASRDSDEIRLQNNKPNH